MLVPVALQHLCVFGLTLNAALSLPEASGQRTVDVVEFWCGVGSIAGAAAAAGYVVRKFDKFRIPGVTDSAGPLSEDLLLVSGFMSAVHCVLSMRSGGLLWMGPVCSSFVFMNSSRCKRTKDNPMGEVNYKPVAEGNLHASVAAFLFALASLRGVLPVVENPAGSIIFRFPSLQLVIDFFSAASAVCCRCVFAKERMGKRFKKAYKLVGHAWVKHLRAPCRCKNGLHCSLVHRVMRHGMVQTSGRKQLLRQSAAYPPKMGHFVIRKWQQNGSASSGSDSTRLMDWKHPVPCSLSQRHSTHPDAWGRLMDWKHPVPGPLSQRHSTHPDASSSSGWKTPEFEDAPSACSSRSGGSVNPPSTVHSASQWKRPGLFSSTPEDCPSKGRALGVTASTGQSSSAWKTPGL